MLALFLFTLYRRNDESISIGTREMKDFFSVCLLIVICFIRRTCKDLVHDLGNNNKNAHVSIASLAIAFAKPGLSVHELLNKELCDYQEIGNFTLPGDGLLVTVMIRQ